MRRGEGEGEEVEVGGGGGGGGRERSEGRGRTEEGQRRERKGGLENIPNTRSVQPWVKVGNPHLDFQTSSLLTHPRNSILNRHAVGECLEQLAKLVLVCQ